MPDGRWRGKISAIKPIQKSRRDPWMRIGRRATSSSSFQCLSSCSRRSRSCARRCATVYFLHPRSNSCNQPFTRIARNASIKTSARLRKESMFTTVALDEPWKAVGSNAGVVELLSCCEMWMSTSIATSVLLAWSWGIRKTRKAERKAANRPS